MPVLKKASAETLALRITVVDPPPNILWALQLGQDEVVKPTLSTKNRIIFDFRVEVVEDSSSSAGFRRAAVAAAGTPLRVSLPATSVEFFDLSVKPGERLVFWTHAK